MTEPRRLRLLLTFPDGEEVDLDVGRYVRGLGKIRESVEAQLLELVHGDLRLRLRDPDGELTGRLLDVSPGDRLQVRVERETGRRRPAYERIFGGVVDCLSGVRIDLAAREVELSAYSYSKALELVTAEVVRRDVSGVTGTVSEGSTVVSVSDASQLETEDEITLRSDVANETHKIVAVDRDANEVTTDEEWDHSFDDAQLILETPYYRSKTVAELVALVINAAGLDGGTIVLPEESTTEIPFADALNDSGLQRNDVRGMTVIGGKIVVWEGTQAYEAPDPWSGFSAADHGDVKPDWRPYFASEPSSLVTTEAVDDGGRVAAHDAGHYFYLCGNPAPGGGCMAGHDVLWRDDDISDPLHNSLGTRHSIEVNPSADCVVVTEGRVVGSQAYTWDGTTERDDYDLNELSEWSETLSQYDVRHVPDGYLVGTPKTKARDYLGLEKIAVFDATNGNFVRELEYRGGVDRWTFRRMGDYLAALREASDGWYVVLWSWDTGSIVAEYKVTSGTGGRAFLTVWTDPSSGEEIGVGFAGPVDGTDGRYFVLSRQVSGVIPYADFDGMSCAEALRQLALVSAAYVVCDPYGHVWFVGRSTALSRMTRGSRELDVQLFRDVRRPIWQWYRSNVEVSATDADGDEIQVLLGDTGDGARRLGVDVSLRITWGLAGVLGAQYLAFHGRVLQQAEMTIAEPDDGPVGVLEHVRLNGESWLVLEAEMDLVRRLQSLTLVSVEEVA